MARYALEHDEINDYVSYSNTNLGAASSADVAFGTFLKIPSNTGTGFKYFLSNGGFAAANKFNAYVYEGGFATTADRNKISIVTGGGSGATDITPVSFDWTTEKCVIFERVSSVWYVWVGDAGGTLTRYTMNTDSTSVDASGWETGRRADGNVDRYFGGNQSGLFWADRGLTQTEADNIAGGANPSTELGASIVANYLFDEGTGSTVNDSESAATGTLTNFPTDGSQWVLVSGGGGTSVTPTATAMAVTSGQAFETSFAKTVEAVSATYQAYSGQAFTLDIGSSFTPDAATYAAYSGPNLSVSAAKAVDQGAATYTPYAGQDTSLTLATVVEQGSATLAAYTGQAITVIKEKTVQMVAATYAAFNRLSFVVEYANKAAAVVRKAAINIRIGLGL